MNRITLYLANNSKSIQNRTLYLQGSCISRPLSSTSHSQRRNDRIKLFPSKEGDRRFSFATNLGQKVI